MILYQTKWPANVTEESAPTIELYNVTRNIGASYLNEGIALRLSCDVRTVSDIRDILAREFTKRYRTRVNPASIRIERNNEV